MTQPAVSAELVPAGEKPRLSPVPRVPISQRSDVADGWVLFVPVAGVAVGTVIREFGVYGVVGSVVGGLVLAAFTPVLRVVVTVRARDRSAQFSARSRPALPPGRNDG